MRRTLVVTTAWITATVLAVSLAFAGVNVVADRVLDPEPSPVVGSAALDDEPEASESPDDEPTVEPDDDATDGPDDDPTHAPSGSPTTAPTTPDDVPTPDDDPTQDAFEPDDDPTHSPSNAPTTSPTASPTPTSSPTSTTAETRTYRMIGGTVTVRFSADRVTVVSATPNDGFSLHEIEQPAPTVVDLEFRAHDDSHRSKLDAWWQDGPRERIREETRED